MHSFCYNALLFAGILKPAYVDTAAFGPERARKREGLDLVCFFQVLRLAARCKNGRAARNLKPNPRAVEIIALLEDINLSAFVLMLTVAFFGGFFAARNSFK